MVGDCLVSVAVIGSGTSVCLGSNHPYPKHVRNTRTRCSATVPIEDLMQALVKLGLRLEGEFCVYTVNQASKRRSQGKGDNTKVQNM